MIVPGLVTDRNWGAPGSGEPGKAFEEGSDKIHLKDGVHRAEWDGGRGRGLPLTDGVRGATVWPGARRGQPAGQ